MCSRSFDFNFYMKRHVLSLHEKKKILQMRHLQSAIYIFLQVDEGKRPFSFIFTNKSNMNIGRYKNLVFIKKIDCHICNKRFAYKWYMNKHVSVMHKEQKNCTWKLQIMVSLIRPCFQCMQKLISMCIMHIKIRAQCIIQFIWDDIALKT